MKNKKLISLIMSLLMIISVITPVTALAEETENVQIVSTTPEDGSVGIIPMGATMEVEFNTAIDPATLTTATISSEPAAVVAVVPDKTKASRCTVYFSALELNTSYKVMFSKQIKSSSGERLQKTDIVFKTTSQYPQHHQIVNGDMEDTTHLNMYELAGATKNVISYQKEDDNTILKFNPGWAGAGVGQYVYLEPGKTYEMRAKVKSTTSQMVRMIMSYVSLAEGASNWWHPIVSKTLPANEWVEFSGTVTIPADLSYDHDRLMRITAQNKSQVIYVDDWQFFETGFDVPMPKASSGQTEGEELKTLISQTENTEAEIEQMVGLGIFEPDTLEKADSKVSRLEAAVYIGRLADIAEMETAKFPTEFVDLEGVKKRDSAQALVDMGIMKGYGKYFYPKNNISAKEALESVVNLLGYWPMAKDLGYSSVISKLKLNKGVKSSTSLTYRDFAKILVNALDTDIMDDYSVVEGEKLLWKALKVKEIKGIITATEYTDIYGGSRALKENIVIDGVSYKVSVDTYGLEGKRVKLFTKEIDGENFVLYIAEINTLNNVLKLNWNDIEEYSEREYTYRDGKNKNKKAKLAADKKLIYNGVGVASYTVDELDVDYGNVQLIDNNNDDVYDIVRIEEFTTYVVKSVNHDNYTIYNQYPLTDEGQSSVLDLSSTDNIIVEENGQKVQFGNIVAGAVVSVAESKDGYLAKLYISKNKVESEVGRVLTDGTEKSIVLYDSIHGDGASSTIDVHPFYAGTKKVREEGPSFIGQNVVISLDYMGYAVEVVFSDGTANWQWGYLVSARPGNDDPSDYPIINLKLFDQSGSFSVLSCARKVKVNRETVKVNSIEDILTAINGNSNKNLVNQLIRYRRNANNEIAQILSSADSENGLRKVAPSGEKRYFSALRSFEYEVVLSTTAIPVISVPTTVTAENEHKFISSTASEYLRDNKMYTFEAYSSDDNELDVEFLVLKDNDVRSKEAWSIGMIMDISNCVDDEGEICTQITVRNSSANNTVIVYPEIININNLIDDASSTSLELKKGDIVKYKKNHNSVIVDMKHIYSIKDKTFTAGGSVYSGDYSIYGTIVKRNGNLISVLPDGEENEENCKVYDLSLYSKILVSDPTGKLPYVGSQADLSEGEKVVIVSSYGAATLLAVCN